VFAMLAKDPAYRPTLAQVRFVITDVRTGTQPQHVATEFVGQRLVKPGRSWAPIIGLLTLVLGIMIGAILTSRSRSVRQPAKDAPVVDAQVPIAEPALPEPTLPEPTPQVETVVKESPRAHGGSGEHSSATNRAPKAAVVVPASLPADAGVDAIVIDTPEATLPPKTKTQSWTDRNQTINPFTKKKTTP
jgi:hypothetical protein